MKKFEPPVYTCEELCGRKNHCGNVACSNHPNYRPKRKKKPLKISPLEFLGRGTGRWGRL